LIRYFGIPVTGKYVIHHPKYILDITNNNH
jgi:hypothetical protein